MKEVLEKDQQQPSSPSLPTTISVLLPVVAGAVVVETGGESR
jgi:hypothetical protein